MLNVGVFDSKQRFIDALRSSFGGGTFMFGEKVALTSVRLLASHLTADYQLQEQPQVFKEANFIGCQEGDYWLLSPKVKMNS